MNSVKAFVGHSFTAADADVVDKFLKFFARLEKMNAGFSWVHAEAAEPKQLSDKVMTLIRDRNLFIGICTRKEMVVDSHRLARLPILNKRYANDDDFEWKTSDWIIQEIGLAKGQNLEMLLLIENGVRKPGGLQGDVEYISFDRAAPEVSFGKIVEMITALTPKSTSVVASPISSAPTEMGDKSQDTASEMEWPTPSPTWRRDQYEIALFHFIYRDDEDGIRRIDEAFLMSPDAQDPQSVASWKAYNQFYRLIFGKGGDLKALQRLSVELPDNTTVRRLYAQALSKFDKHLEAAGEYEIAAIKTNEMGEKASFLGSAAAEYVHGGRQDSASKPIAQLRTILSMGQITETQFLI
ncbi:MAG TPA: hypothetical protein VGP12_03995, partial [Nitrosospira sp.]|nr:hypothetical protein [Nitrosospira sp.]